MTKTDRDQWAEWLLERRFGGDPRSVEAFLQTVGNPRIPSIAEAMNEVLEPNEVAELTAHLRPLVEQGRGQNRLAVAYLQATK